MKTEFLKGLGLDEDAIKSIMAENGKDIQLIKDKLEKVEIELQTKEGLLEEVNTEIQKFKEMDIESIKTSAEEWKTKYETDTKALQDQLASKDYEYNANAYLNNFKFTSDLAKKAVIADFKEKNFKLENGTFLGADDYMKQLQESNPGAFINESKADLPHVVSSTSKNSVNPNRVYTKAEIENMTPEQINNNWTDIQASLAKI